MFVLCARQTYLERLDNVIVLAHVRVQNARHDRRAALAELRLWQRGQDVAVRILQQRETH